MIAGAVLPYCWKKKVEKVTDWVWVRHQELEDDGPTQVYVDEEPEFSRDLLKEYDDHQKRWDKYFGYCERTAVLGFLTALTWTLTCFTIFAIIR